MNDITRILQSFERGDPRAGDELMSAVYEELRAMARGKMARESPGQTLQVTELVHAAWLRLQNSEGRLQPFQSRAHFFGAAAEAMRRILIERARRKRILHKGGFATREELEDSVLAVAAPDHELLAVHECIDQLESEDPQAARLVKLRYFIGLTMAEAAEILGLAQRTAEELWAYARAWLRERLQE